MKKTILLGSAALAIFGLLAVTRSRKVKNKVITGGTDVLLTPSSLKLLHKAKRAAIKEL